MKKFLYLFALIAAFPALAQNAPSNSPRVQGTPTGYGDPVQVTVVDGSGNPAGGDASAANQTVVQANPGSDATKAVAIQGVTGGKAVPSSQSGTWNITDVSGTVSLPTGASTSAKQDTIITALGSPFQAGGSIGNTSFAATQSGTWNITDISGTVVLPTGASTAAKQPALGTAGSASADVITVQGIASGTPLIVGGAVASGATDSGNPVKMGGRNNTTPPTLTDGQRGDLQLDARGSLKVSIFASGSTSSPTFTTGNSDTNTPTNQSMTVFSQNGIYDAVANTWRRQPGDTSGTVTQPYALTGSRWTYAAATGGIVNTTTAVTVVAAAGGSLRNYVTGMQCDSDALGAATELAYRDGAGGTVLWRGGIPTTGWLNGRDIVFSVPLKGTANTLGEIVTLTATVTGGVRCNLQGFTAP